MAGKICPSCGKMTFHKTPYGRECSKCGAKMKAPTPSGKGRECYHCGKFRVFDGTCRECGAEYEY